VVAFEAGYRGVLRVRLSDPSVVDDLLNALREGGAAASRRSVDTISVGPLGPRLTGSPHHQEHVELAFFVGVWKRKHPSVEFEIFE
jgi:hypothetical protein